jgi:hypothetical protein
MIRGILRRPDDHKGVAAMKKKYLVKLTKEERVRLRGLISAGTAPARMLTRARILWISLQALCGLR